MSKKLETRIAVLSISLVLSCVIATSGGFYMSQKYSQAGEAGESSFVIRFSDIAQADAKSGSTVNLIGPKNFSTAKKILEEKVYSTKERRVDKYCGCSYDSKKNVDKTSCGYESFSPKLIGRSSKIEWEHIVPAENFGKSFEEWRVGKGCVGKKGRECAETNPEFSRMEGDMYNLIPVVGEVNALRSNYRYGELSSADIDGFGSCEFKINTEERRAEPPDEIKGWVARSSLYMSQQYPNRYKLSDVQRNLFDAWNKSFPPKKEECSIATELKKLQGTVNEYMKAACEKAQIK